MILSSLPPARGSTVCTTPLPKVLVFLDPESVSRYWRQAIKMAMVPKIRLHDLRHTHATLALQAGVHPKVVSERLGHATVAMTLDIYSHAIPAMQEEAAALIAGLVFTAPQRPPEAAPSIHHPHQAANALHPGQKVAATRIDHLPKRFASGWVFRGLEPDCDLNRVARLGVGDPHHGILRH